MTSVRSLLVVMALFTICGTVCAIIPPEDFAIVQKYAESVTTRGSRFVLAERVATNTTARRVIDVRQRDDYCAGHIAGAINIPYQKVRIYYRSL